MPSGTWAVPVSVHVRGSAVLRPVAVRVSPPRGVVVMNDGSPSFFQVVDALSDVIGESMSVADRLTVVIGSLYWTDCAPGVAVRPRGASLTGLTVTLTVAVAVVGAGAPLGVPASWNEELSEAGHL